MSGRAPLGQSNHNEAVMALIAIDAQSRSQPSAITCPKESELLSCLHAIGCVFAIQHIDDFALNHLIEALRRQRPSIPLPFVVALSDRISRLDESIFIEEVADMHGRPSCERYREIKKTVVRGLKEAETAGSELQINYYGPPTWDSR